MPRVRGAVSTRVLSHSEDRARGGAETRARGREGDRAREVRAKADKRSIRKPMRSARACVNERERVVRLWV